MINRAPTASSPSTRGRGRSLDLAHVMTAVRHAAESGFNEIVLTGVHLGSYGRDQAPASSLLALLHALDAHSSAVTFRISSLEPMDCSFELGGPGGGQRAFRASFPPAAAARQQFDAATNAASLHAGDLSPCRGPDSRSAAAGRHRLGSDRRVSR